MLRRIFCFIGILLFLSGCTVVEEEPKLIFRGEDAFRGNKEKVVAVPEIIADANLEASLLEGYEEMSLEEKPDKMEVLPLPSSVLRTPEIKKTPPKPLREERVFDAVYNPEKGYMETVKTDMVYEEGYVEKMENYSPNEGYLEKMSLPSPRREGYLENVKT